MREQIKNLVSIGVLPAEDVASVEEVKFIELIVSSIDGPITDDEAKAIVSIFGFDEFFGIAWSILHLVETAPHWPIKECLIRTDNPWITILIERAKNAGAL
ncbi:hypothetical protein ACFOSS_02005 [Pseudaeromonas sharmana]|uniref:Uncharacterized protein n=1 Tax=Pseudaeromonas sharmana TaxID=328412 RepID=A0ABV8CJ80_9GAMM